MQGEPDLVDSPFNQTLEIEDNVLQINIYRLETEASWTLEIVNESGTSFVWDESFETDDQALNEAKHSVDEEGVGAFLG
ncbi:hypothetical protein [Vreelandella massiliensis]|uniref:hypothetical protein n=1 Tax=Vreelandella massiliensis TaxID=1816686 RepID=UPI00096A9DF7|nr:hypothetical protein [Halomonas massiliensis]